MSYIGRSPQIGAYHKLDAITTDGSASYTMQLDSANFVPESVNHLIVSVNGVIQAPTDSFTVSGSTITFASSLSVSDTIDFIMALGNVLDIGVPSDATISASKLATTSITGQTAETSANDSDSILIYDDSATALRKMTRANFLTGVGGSNTPAFEAYLPANQSVSSGVATKVQLATEQLDTDGDYDNSTNYRFTPSVAGKYYIYGQVFSKVGVNTLSYVGSAIYKNGSKVIDSQIDFRNGVGGLNAVFIGTIIELNGTTDYVELYGTVAGSGTTAFESAGFKRTYFGGFKLIGA